MPSRPSKACVRCGQKTDGRSYSCPTCTKNKNKFYGRKSAAERGYDERWHSFRERYIRENPYCGQCGRPSKIPHHVIPLRERPDLKYDENNLEPLCIACHGVRHKRTPPGGVIS